MVREGDKINRKAIPRISWIDRHRMRTDPPSSASSEEVLLQPPPGLLLRPVYRARPALGRAGCAGTSSSQAAVLVKTLLFIA